MMQLYAKDFDDNELIANSVLFMFIFFGPNKFTGYMHVIDVPATNVDGKFITNDKVESTRDHLMNKDIY